MGGMTAPASGPAWLAQLAADRAPPPPPWWPPAPGWWLLAAAVLLLVILAAVFGRRAWEALSTGPRALRRATLRELGRLEQAADDAALARGIEHLMRRYAVARFGRAAVAQLSGEAWLAFVVGHGAADWAGESGRALLRAAYGGQASADRARWLGGARAFVTARPVKADQKADPAKARA
jgi:hypothetical protein